MEQCWRPAVASPSGNRQVPIARVGFDSSDKRQSWLSLRFADRSLKKRCYESEKWSFSGVPAQDPIDLVSERTRMKNRQDTAPSLDHSELWTDITELTTGCDI